MNDFVKLRHFLRIEEVGLSLVRYPWIPEMRPFEGWSEAAPSESLSWFDAYNSLKHDKRKNEDQASMKNALNASAAYYALAYFTLGTKLFPGYLSTDFYFHFTRLPKWKTSELYFEAADKRWTSIPVPV